MGDAGPKTNPRTRGLSSPWMPRFRKRGEKILHSKYVVILVILLTITDCALVIAELILDLYSVRKTLSATENQTFSFILAVKKRYPHEFREVDTVSYIYERVANATILWDDPAFDELTLRMKQDPEPNNPTPSITSAITDPPMVNMSGAMPLDRRVDRTGSVTRIIQVDTLGNFTDFNSSRRFRRSFKSNRTSGEARFKNNETGLDGDAHALTLLSVLVQNFRDVVSYLGSGSRVLLENSKRFHNDEAGGDVGEQASNVRSGSTGSYGNIYRRYVEDLMSLYAQLSDMLFTMQTDDRVAFVGAVEPTKQSEDTTVDAIRDDRLASGLTINASTTDRNSELNQTMDNAGAAHFKINPDVSARGGDGVSGDNSREIRGADNTYSGVWGSQDSQQKDADQMEEQNKMRRQLHHSNYMEIAHKLHYASLGVVSILLLGVMLKIVCSGSHFFKRKIQVFDAIVIIASFAVDLTFIKGLAEFAVDESIFVLVFLLPWRVIRVVNSLVMAVIDHEQVKLRLLYSRKKKLDKTVETLRNETDELKGMLQDVRQFCIKEGIDATNIDGMLGKFAPRRRKDSKFYTLVKLVMSTASMNNNDNDSISSSSMENDLRHIATRDSTLAEAPDSQGTMTSLKHYLSVPFCSQASHSSSDVESVAGDVRSPSIFVTSPTSDDGNGAFTFCDVDLENGDSSSAVMDTPDSVIKEEVGMATMNVASSTLNASLHGGVAFFVGSQTSLDARSSEDEKKGCLLPPNQSNENGWPGYCAGAYGGHDSLYDGFDSNKDMFNQAYGQFLTVPQCLVDMVDTPSDNHNNNNLVTNVEHPHLQSPTEQRSNQSAFEMRRSASENVSVNAADSFPAYIQYGSPVPARRVPDLHTKRKEYARSRSESEDKEALNLLRPDTKARFRRHSGEPRPLGKPDLKSELLCGRRSQSPTSRSFLAIPGQSGMGNSASYPSSKSMNDVSSAGNGQSNSSGNDGRILRRSCLSLNSDGRKRRTKSAHRVSFKVS